MIKNLQDLIVYRRLKLRDCLRLPDGWGRTAWFGYARYRKKAEREDPPGINVLWVGVLQGVISKKRSFIDQAEALVRTNVPLDELLRITGAALYHMGFQSEGLTRLRQAITVNPSVENMRELVCHLGLGEDCYDKLRLCKQILQKNKNDLTALVDSGKVLVKFDRYDEAKKFVQRALTISAKDYRAREILGDIYYAKMEFVRALQEYEQAKRYGNKRSKGLWAKMAACRLFLGKWNKKDSRTARDILKSCPNYDSARRLLDEFEGKRQLGVECYSGNNFNLYLYPFLKLESDREDPPGEASLYFAAMETVRTQKVSHIEDCVKKVQGYLPKDLVLRVQGRAKFDIKDYEGAIHDLRSAAHESENVQNMIYLAACLKEQPQYEKEAAEIFRRALSKEPENYEVLWSMGMLAHTDEEALEFFRRASKIQPEDWCMYYNMGKALLSLERFDEAISEYQKARQLVDENPSDISLGIARCYLKMGNFQSARENAERALVEDPNSDDARKFLAESTVN